MKRPPTVTACARKTGSLGLLAWLAACGGATPESTPEAGATPGSGPEAAPTAARYMTHLLFAGADGRSFFATFDQSAHENHLERRYDAWLGGAAGWRQLAGVRDTLPTPRAGWRILPTPKMTVRVGDAGQVVGLAYAAEDERGIPSVRLEAGEELSVWTGPTGQRESLGVAVLGTDATAEPGVLFFRRAARSLRIPAEGGETRAFVLTDSIGNGILLQVGDPTEPVSARTWLHGASDEFSDVLFEATPDSIPGNWRFAIAGTDLSGTIRARSEPDEGLAAFSIECTLMVGPDRFRFVGVSAPLAFP